MDDLIKRDDALAAIDMALNNATGDLFDCSAAIRALPAVTVKPLDKFGVRELARVSGISPTTAMRVKRGEGDLDGSTLRAVLAATGTCLCCGREPQPIDPAAIREATLEARINELEAACWKMKEDRDRAISWRDHDKTRAEAAEAKLAKAGIVALETILNERGPVFDAMVDAAEDAAGKDVSFNVVVGRAIRAALAELERN